MKLKSILSTSLVALLLGAGAASAANLQVWIRASNDSRQIYDKVAAAFTAKTGIKIDYFNATTDFEQRLARAIAGADLPDIIFNDATALGQMVGLGIIEAIDPKTIKGGENVFDVAWASAKGYDGKTYAVPTSAQAFALFVRRDWREKLEMPQPKSWADMAALAKAFTDKDPDGNGKKDTYGFILPGSTTRGYTSWFISSYLWQAGGDFIRPVGNAYKPALEEPAAVETLTFFRKLVCDGVTQPGAINATTADAIPSFRSGQTGMFFSGPYHIALFDKDPGKDKIELIAPPPGPKGVATLAEGTSAFLTKASQNKDAAKQFLEFMISPEAQVMGMAADSSNIPIVRLPVNKTVDVNAVYKDERWAMIAKLFAEHGRYVPQIPNWTPIRQISADDFNRILANCSSDIPAELKATNAKIADELEAQHVLAK